MRLEFNNQKAFLAAIDIEDLGSFAIEATNSDNLNWYYINMSEYGKTTTISFGPIVPDLGDIVAGYSYSLNVSSGDFSLQKHKGALSKWLNDSKKLESAKVIDIDEALDQLPDVKSLYLRKIEGEDL